MSETKTVVIPKTLYEKAHAVFKDSGFTSVDEYVAYVLAQILQNTGTKNEAADSDEDEKVRKRLKALGYME